jgi:proteasome accessory factor B
MSRAERLSHAARILRLRELLDSRPFVTIEGLRAELGVSRRTIYNDLAALQEANVPVYSETGPEGEARWMLGTAARRRTITLSAGQVLPFGAALRMLSFLEGTDLHTQLSTVISRLVEGASPQTQQQLSQLGRKLAIVHHGPKSYREHADVLDDLLSGLLYDELVELTYRPPGQKAREHVVEPMTLLLYREALYLLCHSRTRNERRIFAVDRIVRSKRRRGEKFTYPPDYAPEQVLDGSFGLMGGELTDVEILFDAAQARYVRERRWHPTQSFEDLPDGRVRMRMRVSGNADVALWLLGHTGTAEVVRPEALRAQVHKMAETAVRHHRPRKAP